MARFADCGWASGDCCDVILFTLEVSILSDSLAAEIVRRTPRSAAGRLAGLPVWTGLIQLRRAGPGGPARTRGSAPLTLTHDIRKTTESKYSTFLLLSLLLLADIRARVRHEAVAVGHPDFRQRLGVQHVVLSDDSVHGEYKRHQGVNLIVRERSRPV